MAHRTPLDFTPRRWSLWLVLCVAWFAALAPTLSHALAWSQVGAANYLEICTTTGPRLVAADAPDFSTDSAPGQESAGTLSHCPFCLHNADRCAPPPEPLPYLFWSPGGQQEATVWQAFFYSQERNFAPLPRGPPGRS